MKWCEDHSVNPVNIEFPINIKLNVQFEEQSAVRISDFGFIFDRFGLFWSYQSIMQCMPII